MKEETEKLVVTVLEAALEELGHENWCVAYNRVEYALFLIEEARKE